MFKWLNKKSKLPFENLSMIEASDVLCSIAKDIEDIMKDDKLKSIIAKEAMPKKDIEKHIIDTGTTKLIELVRYFLENKRQTVINILSALMCEDKIKYGLKPFKAVICDIKLIAKNSEIINFFTSRAR